MLTDRQVVLMRQKLMKGKTQQAAAAASDMSERSVRNWNKGPLPSEKKDRRRKSTRPDPFAGVWAEEVEPLLEADVDRILAAPTVLEWLDERHPGRFNASHLRTLQRRIRDWRALNGPEREVYFEQKHPPGREAQMDFTHCDSLKVTIGGEPFEHMVFEFILSHSGWRYAQICYSETFVALVSGQCQGALWDRSLWAPQRVPGRLDAPKAAAKYALRSLACRYRNEEVQQLETELERLTRAAAPALVSAFGVGTASSLLIAAGSNTDRLRGGQERQPVCCDAQAEGRQGPGLQRALQGDTRPLRTEGYQDQLVQCARERHPKPPRSTLFVAEQGHRRRIVVVRLRYEGHPLSQALCGSRGPAIQRPNRILDHAQANLVLRGSCRAGTPPSEGLHSAGAGPQGPTSSRWSSTRSSSGA